MLNREDVISNMKVIRTWAACSMISLNDMGKIVDTLDVALELLAEQEPRVLELEEVKALQVDSGENAPVWIETRIVTDKGILTHLEASILWTVDDNWWRRFGPIHSGWEDRKADTYGVTWRCWNTKPSETQMEVTPWQDQN